MESMEIRSGPCEVVVTGSVIAFKKNAIEVLYGPENGRLKLIFRFVDETGKTDLRVDSKLIDNQTLELTFFNFTSPLGTGNIEPILIGNLAGRPVHLQYRVYQLSGADKTLAFTIYREVGQ